MRGKNIIILFVAMVLLQCAVPVSMIVRREIVLKTGTQYRFKTEPVDPCDAFRGRYVALKVAAADMQVSGEAEYFRGQKLYATVGVDDTGFAMLTALSAQKPDAAEFLPVTVRNTGYGTNIVYLNLPFDRYYMNEKDAPAAELAYRRYSSSEKQDAYVTVRIKSGLAVLEGLYITGRPVEDFLKEQSNRNDK